MKALTFWNPVPRVVSQTRKGVSSSAAADLVVEELGISVSMLKPERFGSLSPELVLAVQKKDIIALGGVEEPDA